MQKEEYTHFSVLEGHAFLSLTTFRKNGEPVTTPVWFAQDGDKLYVMTGAKTGKVRRIHHNAQVEVAPCTLNGTLLGDPLEAMAVILNDGQNISANRTLNHKYGWQKRFYDLTYLLRAQKRTWLEITPM
ncbi:MAG: PPOX class F420-dependent oxidoreductase [Chloroflexi bacterium]|nr:PPOX class F420-dependent oxidoreductase [Chloroflexota bacterium]